MKKLTLLLLIAISCGFYTGVRAQVNVTSVSEKNGADNFYKMMKEAFPLSFNDPASPRFVFFNKNKNFVFGVGIYCKYRVTILTEFPMTIILPQTPSLSRRTIRVDMVFLSGNPAYSSN